MRYSPFVLAILIVCGLYTVVVAMPPSVSPVADAAKSFDTERVRSLLQQGVDVNAPQGDGMSALHWASHGGSAELVGMLVQAGANTQAVTRIGHYTPLHVASKEGNAEATKILLEAGADPKATTTVSLVTPLHLAAASGNVAIVKTLLDYGADSNAKEGEWGQTPLIFAASKNRISVIKILLEHGADPDITTSVVDIKSEGKLLDAATNRRDKVLRSYRTAEEVKAETPVSATQFQAAIVAARELYLSGELPKEDESDGRRRFQSRLHIDAKGGLTALLHAARQGHTESVFALLDGDADVNQVSGGDGTSPLLMATINGQFDLAMMLLERGADPNVSDAMNGATPLWAAINAKWQPRTRYPQPQEQESQTTTYLDLMKALLESGAEPDARLVKHPWYMVYTGCGNGNCGLEQTQGSTAFWRASYATDVEAMRLLVDHGADPSIPTFTPPPRPKRYDGRTDHSSENPLPVQPVGPGLWPATDANWVKPDLSGLPKSKEGDPGVYPIHAASGVGYGTGFAGNAHRHAPSAWLRSIKYLVEELGVDINARDFNGYNALHHAAARGDNEMILYLVENGCDVTAVSRAGQTTADMANGPVSRVSPFPETVALLESLGSKNNHNCVTC